MNYLMEINIPYEILTWSPQEHIFCPFSHRKKIYENGAFYA